MSMYYRIRRSVVQELFSKKVWSSRKTAKTGLFCFHRVTKTHLDKIAFSDTSQFGRMFYFAPTSQSHSIRGLSPHGPTVSNLITSFIL